MHIIPLFGLPTENATATKWRCTTDQLSQMRRNIVSIAVALFGALVGMLPVKFRASVFLPPMCFHKNMDNVQSTVVASTTFLQEVDSACSSAFHNSVTQ